MTVRIVAGIEAMTIQRSAFRVGVALTRTRYNNLLRSNYVGNESMGIKSAVRNTTRAVLKTLSPGPESAAETDLLDTLKKEHDEVKALLSQTYKTQQPLRSERASSRRSNSRWYRIPRPRRKFFTMP